MDLCSPKRYNTNRFFIVQMPHYSRILSPSSWQLYWLSRKLNFSSGFRSVASSVALHWSKYSGNIVDNVYDTLCLLYENGSTGAECRLVVRSIVWSTQAYIFSVGLFPHSEPHIFSLLVTETGDLIFIVIVAVVVRPHRMHRVQRCSLLLPQPFTRVGFWSHVREVSLFISYRLL